MVFTNKSNVYKLKLHEVEDTKASQFGVYLPNLLSLEDGEQIIGVHNTADYSGYMLFGFATGKIAKIPVNSYETKTNRKKLVKAFYGGAPCIGLTFAEDRDYIKMIREDDKGAIINVALIEEKQKRDAGGVQALAVTKKAGMKQFEKIIEPSEEIRNSGAKSLPAAVKTL